MDEHSKSNNIRLFYLGSGEIGVPVLDSLVSCQKLDLVGCATQPNRPKGRKRILTPTPIGQKCEDLRLQLEKPDSVNTADFLKHLRSLNLDLIVVFSFGQILRQPLLNLPGYGCLNIHTSLLPKYRGASPITAAILAGETTTGISFIKMDEGLDTGPIYKQVEISIPEDINVLELEKKMAAIAAEYICDVVIDIVRNGRSPNEQGNLNISHTKKVKKDDGRIQWKDEASNIERKIRAYYLWPGAWFILNKQNHSRKITITAAKVIDRDDAISMSPGTVTQADNCRWEIACGKDNLVLKRVIPEGKREMTSTEYLRGNPVKLGSVI